MYVFPYHVPHCEWTLQTSIFLCLAFLRGYKAGLPVTPRPSSAVIHSLVKPVFDGCFPFLCLLVILSPATSTFILLQSAQIAQMSCWAYSFWIKLTSLSVFSHFNVTSVCDSSDFPFVQKYLIHFSKITVISS